MSIQLKSWYSSADTHMYMKATSVRNDQKVPGQKSS